MPVDARAAVPIRTLGSEALRLASEPHCVPSFCANLTKEGEGALLVAYLLRV